MNDLIEENIDIVRAAAKHFKQDDDLFQIGLIALWEAIQKWDGEHPLRPWAARVVKNRMLDYIRKKRPQEEELTEDVPTEEPEEAETSTELKKRIESTFPKRSRERRVLMLLMSGKTKDQIAERMKISKRTVDRLAKQAYSTMQERRE